MDDDLLNILSNSNKDIDNQKLMDYLSDKLPDNEKHEFEKHLVDSDMLNDAIEGLGKFKDKKNVAAFVAQLNANLKKQLAKPKEKRMKRTGQQTTQQPARTINGTHGTKLRLIAKICFTQNNFILGK